MAIIQILTETPGQINTPNIRRVRIISTDNLATVTTAGYLNQASLQGNTIYNTDEIVMWYGAVATASGITSPGTFETFTASITNGIITLVVDVSGGNVLLPVVNNDFAVFNGTSGQIKDGGYLPSDATKTRVVMVGSATTIGLMAKFVDITGTIDDTAGAVSNLGNISAGASGTAGTFISFPTTAANGSFIWAAVGNAGNFNATLSPVSTLGQATVYTLPDAGNALARTLVGATATPFVSGNFPVASGTGGLMVDSGLAAANIQNKTNIIAGRTADIGGAGAGPHSIVVAGLTAASIVTATIQASSNIVAVAKATATATGFDVLFDGDPGAAVTVNYVAFIAAQ